MSDHILLIFEGQRLEPQVYDNLSRYFLNESAAETLTPIYGSNIYNFYDEISAFIEDGDEFDIIPIIKEKLDNEEKLKGVNRKNVSEIYYFFDFDGHDTKASVEKIEKMLQVFDEETDKGRLYISYPMGESLIHINDNVDFSELTHISSGDHKKDSKAYKGISRNSCNNRYSDITKLRIQDWCEIIEAHCKKANYLISDQFSFPNDIIYQNDIFSAQNKKYLEPKSEVSVLSGFPLHIFYHYGAEQLRYIIGENCKLGKNG